MGTHVMGCWPHQLHTSNNYFCEFDLFTLNLKDASVYFNRFNSFISTDQTQIMDRSVDLGLDLAPNLDRDLSNLKDVKQV